MIADCYSGSHSATEPSAVAAFEAAVWNVLAHRPAAGAALAEALSIDPGLTAAHALKGLAGVTLARSETLEAAGADLSRARASLDARGGGWSERALVAALDCAVSGRLRDAAAGLHEHVADHPRDLLCIKLAHGLRFMSGDAAGMLATTSAVLPHWSTAMPGYGFLLGCHAFGLEETGSLDEAEGFGRCAVTYESADAWGLHAVGHVYEMQGRISDGVAWLEGSRSAWTLCNNFSFHMAWHLALFHLARGRADLALGLYDTHVRPSPTDDFRDIANAVSLLWRLRQEGVAVGDRWAELAARARDRASDTTLMFASLHHLLTLVAVGDLSTARALVAEIAAKAQRADGDQSEVARDVGLDLARAILSLSAESGARIASNDVAYNLRMLGGSNAQRDVFMRTLAQIAAQAGDAVQVETILAARRRLRQDDHFARIALDRLRASRDMFRQVA